MKTRFFLKNLGLFLVPLLIPVIILGTLSIVVTRQYVAREWGWTQSALLHSMDRSMELVVDEMDTLYYSLMQADMMVRLEEMLRTQQLSLENLRLLQVIQSFMNGPSYSKPYLDSIYVYVPNPYGQFLTSAGGLTSFAEARDSAWKDSFDIHREETGMWLEKRMVRRYAFEPEYPLVSMYRVLRPSVGSPAHGVVVINVNAQAIGRQLELLKNSTGQQLYVLDGKGDVLFRSAGLGEELPVSSLPMQEGTLRWISPAGGAYSVSQAYSELGWRYISMIPESELNRIPDRLGAYTGWLVALSIFLGMGLAGLLTWRNIRHVRRMITIIQHAEQGLVLPASRPQPGDAYDYITQKVLSTFIERHYLTMQLSEKKYRLQTAELLALQAQINPHFLYNTLEIINWRVIALTGAPNEASRMLSQLGKLLQYAMTAPGAGVTLQEEINNTQHYLALQTIRFAERLKVDWQVGPDLETMRTIRLLLQPLAENTIRHGFASRNGDLKLRIRIIKAKGELHLTVIDNGAGMSKVRLAEVKRRLETDEEADAHIGLANTNRRLRLAYPGSRGLMIRSKAGWGTVVTARLPLNMPPQPPTGS